MEQIESVGLGPVYEDTIASLKCLSEVNTSFIDRPVSVYHVDAEGTETWKTGLPYHVVDADGTETWKVDGLLHRVDGPARIWKNGVEEYWENGFQRPQKFGLYRAIHKNQYLQCPNHKNPKEHMALALKSEKCEQCGFFLFRRRYSPVKIKGTCGRALKTKENGTMYCAKDIKCRGMCPSHLQAWKRRNPWL